jgi:hypothetical protein
MESKSDSGISEHLEEEIKFSASKNTDGKTSKDDAG